MRGLNGQEITIITGARITTAYAARLDFQSGPVFVWTGGMPIQPTGSGDSLLNGNVYDPIAAGVVVEVGENTFSYSGSDELKVVLAVPSAPNTAIAAAEVYPQEYQGRQATIWRALLYPQSDPLAQPIWLFRRIRTGAMDKVEIQNDGQSHNFHLTIESHQSLISSATNSTYLDQSKFDPADTSQAYAVSIANGDPAPTNSGVVGPGSFYIPNGSVLLNGKFNIQDS